MGKVSSRHQTLSLRSPTNSHNRLEGTLAPRAPRGAQTLARGLAVIAPSGALRPHTPIFYTLMISNGLDPRRIRF